MRHKAGKQTAPVGAALIAKKARKNVAVRAVRCFALSLLMISDTLPQRKISVFRYFSAKGASSTLRTLEPMQTCIGP
jgi:hypothetical protein